MTLLVWKEMKIDRLGMTRSDITKDQRNFLIAQIHSIKEEQKALVPAGRISIKYCPKQHATRMGYHPLKKGPCLADIILGTTPQKKFYVTMTVYPSTFAGSAFEQFQHTTDLLLDQFAYRYFYSKGLVSYIEVALDSMSFKREDLLLMRLKAGVSHVFIRPDGTCGTLTLGGLSSPRKDRMYDKKRQLLEVRKILIPEATLTRLEVVLRTTGLKPTELHGLPNPFEDLHLIPIEDAAAMCADASWTVFIDRCITHGIPAALADVPALRKKYRARLLASRASWWNPHFMWTSFPAQLGKIKPCVSLPN